MTMVVALYKKPADPAAFDSYYFSTHVPIAKAMPGLRSCQVSAGPPRSLTGGGDPPYLVALLEFESAEAAKIALASPEGVATAQDLGNFAQAGVELLLFETKAV